MILKYKIYISFTLSFFLLIISLYFSYSHVSDNGLLLKYFERDNIKLKYYIREIDKNIKRYQFNFLETLIFQAKNRSTDIPTHLLNEINTSIFTLELFIQEHQDLKQKFNPYLDKLRKDTNVYILFSNNVLLKHIQGREQEKLLQKSNHNLQILSQELSILSEFAKAYAYQNILELEKNNKTTTQTLFFSFVISSFFIFFAIYNFLLLHKNLNKQLKRAKNAENDLLLMQEKLLEYNDKLEEEITKTTKELHQKIYTHFLSGLPNRNRLLEDANTYNFSQMAILNIDKFQSFNDVYGEEIGNIAIELTARFLQTQIEEPELYLYHIGGDEFVIVCRDSQIVSHNSFIEKIEILLKNYESEVFNYDDETFSFIMSTGISFTGEKKMLAYADMALKDAKKRNIQISIFSEDKGLEQVHKDDMQLHKILVEALEKEKVISHFQPIVPIQDKSKPNKYESLVRIENNGTIIPPFEFLNIAKANRIYYKITNAVIKNTLHVISNYQIPCSLNISLMDINNKRTMKHFFDTIEYYEYNNLLTIELLETEEFQDYKVVADFCVKVRSFGIKVALDDFGAGYSNFSHILKLPVDYIKIDASLISNIDRDNNAKIMVETIVALAKKLHMETIAEFVSSQEILDVIRDIGVDYAQGYHMGKPEAIKNHLKL